MAKTDLSRLVGYCGLYCNACGIRQGKMKNAVNNLRNVIGVYGFGKMMLELAKWEPSFEHYKELGQVMNGLIKMFGSRPSCFKGGGGPNCRVPLCAMQKGYRTCMECSEAETCEKLAPYCKGYRLSLALKTIRQKGIGRYAGKCKRKLRKDTSAYRRTQFTYMHHFAKISLHQKNQIRKNR